MSHRLSSIAPINIWPQPSPLLSATRTALSANYPKGLSVLHLHFLLTECSAFSGLSKHSKKLVSSKRLWKRDCPNYNGSWSLETALVRITDQGGNRSSVREAGYNSHAATRGAWTVPEKKRECLLLC